MRYLIVVGVLFHVCAYAQASELSSSELQEMARSIGESIGGKVQSKQEETTGRNKRIVVYTADWANYEDEIQEALERLEEKGWQIGESPDNHIQVKRLDPHSPELSELRIGNLPVFIKLWHGCEYERHTGRLTSRDISEMYYGRDYGQIVQQRSTQKRESASIYTRDEADRYLRQNYGMSVDEVEERFGQPIEELAKEYGIRVEGREYQERQQRSYRRGYQAPIEFERSDCAT